MNFINSIVAADGTTQPFFIHKRVPAKNSDLLDTGFLTKIGLLDRGVDGLHWNAYYFAIFHF